MGEAELILRIWGAKENTFRELRNFLSGIWGEQCGSREHTPHAPGASQKKSAVNVSAPHEYEPNFNEKLNLGQDDQITVLDQSD